VAKVSIVIPVYNGERYIKDAIDSVLNQTISDTEIVIINDASTDKTEELIFDNYKDLINSGKIKYLKNDTNKERVFCRNIGAENSKGEYIYFLDYDDKWDKTHLEKSLPYFKKYEIVYYFPRSYINEKSHLVRKSKKKIPTLEKLIFTGNIGYPSASAFRKNAFLKYKQEFLMREDWEIFIRSFLKKKSIFILDEDTVFIREHSNRTSRKNSFYTATLKVYTEYKDKIPPKYLPYFQMHVSDVAFKFGDFKTGYKMFFSAVSKNPKVLLDKRNFLNFLKRSVRIDRFILNR
jgi:glycosyltransferase involved in cell wall biosynthesis